MLVLKQAVSLLALALVALTPVFAESEPVQIEREANLAYGSPYSPLSCEYAEKQATAFVKELGGSDVHAICTGGQPDYRDLWVRVKFNSTYDAAGAWRPIEFKVTEACEFNRQLLDNIMAEFDIREMKFKGSCWHSEGKFRVTALVWK